MLHIVCNVCIVKVNTEKAELLSELCVESGQHQERPPKRVCLLNASNALPRPATDQLVKK